MLNCVLSLLNKPLLALDATYGFWGLIILMCWQQIGYMMIIYIAGLQSIPEDYIEAAKIDGASSIQTLFFIKIPNVMPSITICTYPSYNIVCGPLHAYRPLDISHIYDYVQFI